MATEQSRRNRFPEHFSGNRTFRGLFLVFFVTFLNLAGMALTAIGLNAFGYWTLWQFVGLFGVIETASGLANVQSGQRWSRSSLH